MHVSVMLIFPAWVILFHESLNLLRWLLNAGSRGMHCHKQDVADFSECASRRAEHRFNINIQAGSKPARSPMDADRKMNRYIARIEKKALEKGIALGRAAGRAEALAEKARPMQTALLYFLEERFGEVTDPVRSCILNITDAVKIIDVADAARKLDRIEELERLLSSSS